MARIGPSGGGSGGGGGGFDYDPGDTPTYNPDTGTVSDPEDTTTGTGVQEDVRRQSGGGETETDPAGYYQDPGPIGGGTDPGDPVAPSPSTPSGRTDPTQDITRQAVGPPPSRQQPTGETVGTGVGSTADELGFDPTSPGETFRETGEVPSRFATDPGLRREARAIRSRIAREREGVEVEDVRIDLVRRDGRYFFAPEIGEEAQRRVAFGELQDLTETDIELGDVIPTTEGYTVSESVRLEEAKRGVAETLGLSPTSLVASPTFAPSPGTPEAEAGLTELQTGFVIDQDILDAVAALQEFDPGAAEQFTEPVGDIARAYGDDPTASDAPTRTIPHPLTVEFRETQRVGSEKITRAAVTGGQAIVAEAQEGASETAEKGRGFLDEVTSFLDRSDSDVEGAIERARERDFLETTQEGAAASVPDLSFLDRSDSDVEGTIEEARGRDFAATTREGATVTPTPDLSFLDRSDSDVEGTIEEARGRDFAATTRAGREETIEAATGPIDALTAGFGEPSGTDLQEARRAAFPDITEELAEQLSEETGADLGPEDVNLEFGEDNLVIGTLSPSGESDVAASRAPLQGVPVLGDVLARGARLRTGYQQAFEPTSRAFREATPSQEDIGAFFTVGTAVAVAEPTPAGEATLGAAALGVTSAAVGATAYDAIAGQLPEAESEVRADEGILSIDLSGVTGPTEYPELPASLGEIPAPTRSPEEPFPTEYPAPESPREPFPGEVPEGEVTDPQSPFPGEIPEQEVADPQEPFPGEVPEGEVTDPQEPFPEDVPPIDVEVGDTVGGPAAFAPAFGSGQVGRERREEEESPFVDEGVIRRRRRRERSELARQAYEQTLYEQEREYGEVVRESIVERSEGDVDIVGLRNPDIRAEEYEQPFWMQAEEELTPYERQTLAGMMGSAGTQEAQEMLAEAERPEVRRRELLAGTVGEFAFESAGAGLLEESSESELTAEEEAEILDRGFESEFEEVGERTFEELDEQQLERLDERQEARLDEPQDFALPELVAEEQVTAERFAQPEEFADPVDVGQPLEPGYPFEPGYPQEPGYPPAYPPTTITPPRTPRPRVPIDLPEQRDRDEERIELEGVAAPILTDFINPLTGEVIETERDVGDFGSLLGA